MLSSNTQGLLADCLTSIASRGRQIESFKNRLCETESFSISSVLTALDRGQNASLGPNELHSSVSPQYSTKIVSGYDRNGDGRLDFYELSDLLLPANNPILKRRCLNCEDGIFSSRVHERMGDLLQAECELIRTLELWKEKLEQAGDFNQMSAYLSLKGNCQTLDERALWHFFGKLGISISEEDIKAIVFRMSKLKDGVISYRDFVEVFSWDKRTHKTLRTTIMDSPARTSPLKDTARSAFKVKSRLDFWDPSSLFEGFVLQARTLEEALAWLIDTVDFNLEDAYSMFDDGDKGFIAVEELEETLRNIGVNNYQDCRLICKDGKMEFNNFFKLLTPISSELYCELRRRRSNEYEFSKRYSKFSTVTTQRLAHFFEVLLTSEKELADIKGSLREDDVKESFCALDNEQCGYIRFSSLDTYLKDRGVNMNQTEIETIMRKLDVDKDGRVSYRDYLASILS